MTTIPLHGVTGYNNTFSLESVEEAQQRGSPGLHVAAGLLARRGGRVLVRHVTAAASAASCLRRRRVQTEVQLARLQQPRRGRLAVVLGDEEVAVVLAFPGGRGGVFRGGGVGSDADVAVEPGHVAVREGGGYGGERAEGLAAEDGLGGCLAQVPVGRPHEPDGAAHRVDRPPARLVQQGPEQSCTNTWSIVNLCS
jgi:hypothetical protein